MILRWTDRNDGLDHETPVDRVEFRPDGTVEAYRKMVVPVADPTLAHLAELRFVGVQQLAPSDVQGRVLVL